MATPLRGSAKNRNTPGFQYSSTAGPFEQWPLGIGFEYFYGFLDGEPDQWQPYLFRDHTQIFPWVGKKDYNLTTDFKGKFDMGWNVMREQIFANQKKLGVIPANAELTPWPADQPNSDMGIIR
jgi:arylsulfatase A-like enzyme